MKEKFSLKDHLFNAPKVALLADSIKNVYATFDKESFERDVLEAFPRLELKERITHIRMCLKKYLAVDYQEAVNIILQALPKPLDEHLNDDDFGDFIYAPYHDFVAHFGCSQEHLLFSLAALKEMTKTFFSRGCNPLFYKCFSIRNLKNS